MDEPDGPLGRRGEFLSPALAEQAVKNLVFLAAAMGHHPHLCEKPAAPPRRSRAAGDTLGAALGGAGQGAGSGFIEEDEEEKDRQSSEGEEPEDEEEQEDEEENEDEDEEEDEEGAGGGGSGAPSDPLEYLMRRTNMMSRRRGDDRRAAVFQWYGAFAATQPEQAVSAHLGAMVDALFRAKVDGQSAQPAAWGTAAAAPPTTSAAPGPGGSSAAGPGAGSGAVAEAAALSVGALCDEVLALLEEKVGAAAFLATHGEVQRRFLAKRDKRRRAKAAEALTDPEAFAARKLARNRQKAEGEKRRKRAFGEMRKAGGSRGKGKGRGGKGGKGGGGGGGGPSRGLKHGGGGFGRKRAKA